MIRKIIKHSTAYPKTIRYKLYNNIATLEDQDEACQTPAYAYLFVRDIPGANIEKCQEVACRNPKYAYYFVRDVPGASIEKCQEAACKDPEYAYYFALLVPGANVKKCQLAIIKDEYWLDRYIRMLKSIGLSFDKSNVE